MQSQPKGRGRADRPGQPCSRAGRSTAPEIQLGQHAVLPLPITGVSGWEHNRGMVLSGFRFYFLGDSRCRLAVGLIILLYF